MTSEYYLPSTIESTGFKRSASFDLDSVFSLLRMRGDFLSGQEVDLGLLGVDVTVKGGGGIFFLDMSKACKYRRVVHSTFGN